MSQEQPKKEEKKKMGRPSIFNKELGDKICQRISEGESVRSIVKDENMPSKATIFSWVLEGNYEDCENKELKAFSDQYARAREMQAENMFEEIVEISDGATSVVKGGAEKKSSAIANTERLRVDSRKWYLSKVLPKKYGDKLDVTSDNKPIKQNGIMFVNFGKEDATES